MNTKIEYQYRDASNYKRWGVVVLEGTMTPDQLKLVTDGVGGELGDSGYFLPDQVGLPTLQEDFGSSYEDDHIWHELWIVEETEERPGTIGMTAAEWAEEFRDIKWDEEAAQARLDEWMEA